MNDDSKKDTFDDDIIIDKPADDQPLEEPAPKPSTEKKGPFAKKNNALQEKVDHLTEDLQRTRADFENYRKRMDAEKIGATESGKASAILKLLPVIDNIERAITYMPDDLKDNAWAQSVSGLVKNLEKSLDALNLQRIKAAPGTDFNPEHHEAISFDDNAEGEKEVIAEELQAGYTLSGRPIRHAMVRVTRG